MKPIIYFNILFYSFVLLYLQSCTKEPIEEDSPSQVNSVVPEKIFAHAGEDMQLTLPMKNLFLDGTYTSSLNPENLNLEYEWLCLSYPPSSVSPFIELPGELESRVFNFNTGIYLFQLKAKYQKLVSFDTVKFVINPDPLKGKTVIYDNLTWGDIEYVQSFEDWIPRMGIILTSPDFYFRETNDLKIEFWDEDLLTWNLVSKTDLYFENPGKLLIFHPDSFNLTLAGKKTKIRIVF